MNREILFKAKRKDNGKWVYGWIHRALLGDVWYLIEEYDYKNIEVIPETICQYTGLKDKNDVKIFENDILYAKEDYDKQIEGKVDIDMKYGLCLEGQKETYHFDYICELEVIGNIFDKGVK